MPFFICYILFKNQFNDFLVILAISIKKRVGTAVLPDSYALITECVVFKLNGIVCLMILLI